MADWKVFITIKRRGNIVPLAQIIMGHFGKFIGDKDGIVEIETEEIPLKREIYIPLIIKDPKDNIAITCSRLMVDTQKYEIDMSSHGRYQEPNGYIPPQP